LKKHYLNNVALPDAIQSTYALMQTHWIPRKIDVNQSRATILKINSFLPTFSFNRPMDMKVGPDGTAYVPTADCDGKQSMAVSKDNGLTWTVDEVPGSTTQDESDPHLGIGDKGTMYFGWQGGDGKDLALRYRIPIRAFSLSLTAQNWMNRSRRCSRE